MLSNVKFYKGNINERTTIHSGIDNRGHPAGGAIFVAGSGLVKGTGLEFEQNVAFRYEYYAASLGGAVAIDKDGSFECTRCLFKENRANGWVYGGKVSTFYPFVKKHQKNGSALREVVASPSSFAY